MSWGEFLHMTNFFSTDAVCGVCDKYQVWARIDRAIFGSLSGVKPFSVCSIMDSGYWLGYIQLDVWSIVDTDRGFWGKIGRAARVEVWVKTLSEWLPEDKTSWRKHGQNGTVGIFDDTTN